MMLRGRRYLTIVPLSLLVGVAACGGSEPTPVAPPPPPPPAAEAPPPPPPAPEPPPPETPSLPDVAFGATTPSDAPKKTPKVTLKTPTAEQVVAADKAKDFEIKLEVKDWETQPGGPHTHLILDNKPYKPIYEPKATVKVSDLTGGEALAEGEHLLVAFPSRMNHESVKEKGALTMVHFWVGKKGKSDWKAKDPMLIYSRPKGAYNASKADHVLVDWYLSNVELGEGKFSIKANVIGPGVEGEGKTLKITEWKPHVLDNLRNGDYKIALELDDKDGKAVPGAWNSTTRTITINRDAPEDPPMAAPAPAPEKEKADKDKKKDDKPAADKPKDDKATPASDKPKDKPAADKPAADKPKDKPADKPKEEKK
jgi:hypothetical protein